MKISGTITPEQEDWIKEKIHEGKFYNISHVLRESIKLLQDKYRG